VSTTRSETKDDFDGKPISQSWVRIQRIGKVAKFSFALLTVFFAAIIYFLRPYCCEAGNTLNRFTLQVRYPRGPPPVWAGNTAGIGSKNIDVKDHYWFLTKINKMCVYSFRIENRHLTIRSSPRRKAVRGFLASARVVAVSWIVNFKLPVEFGNAFKEMICRLGWLISSLPYTYIFIFIRLSWITCEIFIIKFITFSHKLPWRKLFGITT